MHTMPSHPQREHTVSHKKTTAGRAALKALMAEDQEFMRHLVREAMQQILEAEMADALGDQLVHRDF